MRHPLGSEMTPYQNRYGSARRLCPAWGHCGGRLAGGLYRQTGVSGKLYSGAWLALGCRAFGTIWRSEPAPALRVSVESLLTPLGGGEG
jgi:hypothetical protein